MKPIKYFFKISGCLMLTCLIACKKNDTSTAATTTTPVVVAPVVDSVALSNSKYVLGADLSSVNMVQAYSGIYKDAGVVTDPFTIFKNHGCNTVRVRLFVDPTSSGGYNSAGYCGLADVEKTILKAKNLGMSVILDLHYSDTWADPAHQTMPARWNTGLTLSVLGDSIYQYTTSVLKDLQSKSLVPEMIQVGNEIYAGMVWPTGKVVSGDYTAMAAVVNRGIKAVRDFSVTSTIKPQIIIQTGGDCKGLNQWYTNIAAKGIVDFDIIGISYYESYTAQNFSQLAAIVKLLKTNFNKKVMVAETNYQWSKVYQDGTTVTPAPTQLNGYPVTPQGQNDYLLNLTQQVITAGGIGVVVWEPAWISNSQSWGLETLAYFDFSGNLLPTMTFMKYKY